VFCEAVLTADPALLGAIAHLAESVGRHCGHFMSVRNERVYMGLGGYFEHVKGRSGSYVCVIPLDDSRIQMDQLVFETMRHPMDLVQACMLFAITHVGTLSGKYEADYSSRTMEGGMSSAILDVSQELSDMATHIGALLIIEIRDDYTKADNSDGFGQTNEMGVPTRASKFMATNELALYILQKGRGVVRHRGFHAEATEYIAQATWEKEHLNAVLQGYVPWDDNPQRHGVEEINDFLEIGEILGIESKILDIME
jgi:hypothetical protein